MPKRSNEFQRLVAMLTMLKSEGATVHESVEVMEIASKERREVDVVAFGKVAGHQSAVFIECRDWKRPRDVQWVEQARTKFDDAVVEDFPHGSICHVPTATTRLRARVRLESEPHDLGGLLLSRLRGISPGSDHSHVFPDYSHLFADRTLLAERLSTSTLEPIAQQLKPISSVMVNSLRRTPRPPGSAVLGSAPA